MRSLLTAALCASFCFIPSSVPAQGGGPQQRAQEIAASFNKSKHTVKEKYGVRAEKFKDVRSELNLKRDVRAYSGVYEGLTGYLLDIRVSADGRVQASGTEPGLKAARSFTLRDASIEGGMLTGTKVYADGAAEKFEGVFIKRTERNSPSDGGVTTFGLGVIYDPPKVAPDYGLVLSRLFYQQREWR
ncbi:MAG TPA: hypothetical protein VF723_10670 [Pyrinomonadaceae bacterium]|jgi:hypothetical protein